MLGIPVSLPTVGAFMFSYVLFMPYVFPAAPQPYPPTYESKHVISSLGTLVLYVLELSGVFEYFND